MTVSKGYSPKDQEVESKVFRAEPLGFIYKSTRTYGTGTRTPNTTVGTYRAMAW